MSLTDFPAGTTKTFSVTIDFNGAAPDITPDTVTVTFKSQRDLPDSGAVIQETADVTTSGATGIALFDLDPTVTDETPGRYEYDIVWALVGGDEYVLTSGTVRILDRVSDT